MAAIAEDWEYASVHRSLLSERRLLPEQTADMDILYYKAQCQNVQELSTASTRCTRQPVQEMLQVLKYPKR